MGDACNCLANARCQPLSVTFPTTTQLEEASCCCPVYKRKCQQLRVVVITTGLWDQPIVPPAAGLGYGGTSGSRPNCPPNACLLSPGLARQAQISGPGAVPSSYIPDEVLVNYPVGRKTALVYDFGSKALYKGEAQGKLLARSAGTCTSASLDFTYTWCGQGCAASGTCDTCKVPPACAAAKLRFEVTKCTYNGIKFQVLETFISSNPCLESVVVVSLQQYCPPGNCPDYPVSTTCSGVADGCQYKVLPCGTFGPGGTCFDKR